MCCPVWLLRLCVGEAHSCTPPAAQGCPQVHVWVTPGLCAANPLHTVIALVQKSCYTSKEDAMLDGIKSSGLHSIDTVVENNDP